MPKLLFMASVWIGTDWYPNIGAITLATMTFALFGYNRKTKERRPGRAFK